MDEQTIVENLRANLPQPQEFTPPTPEQPNTDQDHSSVGMKLDDITQYKLHDFFGAKYKPSDEISNQQVSYIYEHVAETLENPEYSYVVAKIRDLERILGTSNSSQRVFKLYQWLKLDNMRKNIEREQGALTNEW